MKELSLGSASIWWNDQLAVGIAIDASISAKVGVTLNCFAVCVTLFSRIMLPTFTVQPWFTRATLVPDSSLGAGASLGHWKIAISLLEG